MAEKIKMPSSKKIFLLLLVVFLWGVIRYAYLFVNTSITKRLIVVEQGKVTNLQQEISAFSDIPGFDKLQVVKDMENNHYQMLWSERIQAVIDIFDAILEVDTAESRNIVLSDFKISLEEISLHGYVSNLRVLYLSPDPEKKTALLDRFEQLDFLTEISIRTYERADDSLGYNFVLTAKVINDDTK